jgi:peptide/nickel transport system substrate-binding protein
MKRFVLSLLSAVLITSIVEAATLRVGGTQAPPTLGNPYSAIGPPPSAVWLALYDGLTVIDENGKLAPALAESWTNPTPTTWVFKLRPNVTFHNGEPFNAQTVVDVITMLKQPDAQKYISVAELRIIKEVKALDPMTVEFTTNEPDAILPKRLNIIMMVEPKAWKTLGADAFALKPVGTGPFQLIDWGKASGKIKMSVFKNSWRKSAEVDALELYSIMEASSRMQAILSGQVDIMVAPSPEDAKLLKEEGFKVSSPPVAVTMSIAFRTERLETVPLKDKRVRQALNMAVDRDAMSKQILDGMANPAYQGATPAVTGYNPDLPPIPYDPAKAKKLLAEAGYPNGFDLKFEVLTNLGNSDTAIYQKMAEDLGKIGVNVELRQSTFASWLTKYSSNQWGDIDAFSITWNSAPFQDVIRPVEYFSCLKAAAFFCDPSVVPLIKKSNQTLDEKEREKLLQQIMAQFRDSAPALLLVDFPAMIVTSPRIKSAPQRVNGVSYEKVTFNK